MKTISFDFDNVGGISSIYAIPPTSLVRVRRDYVNDKYYPEFTDRENIIRIPIYADNTFQFSEQQTREDGGELYAINIAGVIPKLTSLNASVIRTLEHGDWYVLHQDRNGCNILSGSDDVPLHFLSNKTTGKNVEELNGNSFTFTGNEKYPSILCEINDINHL